MQDAREHAFPANRRPKAHGQHCPKSHIVDNLSAPYYNGDIEVINKARSPLSISLKANSYVRSPNKVHYTLVSFLVSVDEFHVIVGI